MNKKSPREVELERQVRKLERENKRLRMDYEIMWEAFIQQQDTVKLLMRSAFYPKADEQCKWN